ncbi:hypothetical protein SDC9_114831 [bioreactor metagenome]|uniref:Uncharacterized protein n=1 Tax=bioreactor metagenome TaxID=1076179 RepID=A0A645BRC2_9ZZZZ
MLGQRTIGEDVDPDLATTLDVTGHRNTRGLDLPVGQVGRLQRLNAVVAEGQLSATLGQTVAVRAVLLAVLHSTRNQHAQAPAFSVAGALAAPWSAAAGASLRASSARLRRPPRSPRSRPSPRPGRRFDR